MKMFFLFSFLFVSFKTYPHEFEDIVLSGYDKEILSSNKIRFFKKDSSDVIYVQADHYNKKNTWSEKNLKKDMQEMFETRKYVYSLFGFSNIDFKHYELKNTQSKNPILDIYGSYNKLKDKKVFFVEENIYFNKNFLQVKILDEKRDVTKKRLEAIIKEINYANLDID